MTRQFGSRVAGRHGANSPWANQIAGSCMEQGSEERALWGVASS
jgi:hypothetical protein